MENSLLVISAYPPKGSLYGHKMTGAASYTKNTLLQLKKYIKGKITVLAETTGKETETLEEGISINRVWKRDSFKLYFIILREVFKQRKVRDVLFAFEWSMFGDNRLHLAVVPLFIVAMRLLGKRVIFVSHAVLLNADSVSDQVGMRAGSLKPKLLTFALKAYYWLVVNSSTKVVLFEESLRQELIGLTGKPKKMVTIPHGVDEANKTISRSNARKLLGYKNNELVIMYFGFLIWYKGVDWLVENMSQYLDQNPNANVKLLIAGGENPRFKSDSVYRGMIEKIDKLAKRHKGEIKITGFVKEEDIPLYFAASDVLFMPHRVFVSSSGPLSLSFTYKKPVVFSENLASYFNTPDMAEALKKNKLKSKDILFTYNSKGFNDMIRKCKNKTWLGKLTEFSKEMKNVRSWEKTGEQYYMLLKTQK